ncbi:hypothetical protein [Demequina salsinemoris]|uniref:hypothetical protein n=1 Tax=Demequina salsinemoris TaxID=577470 RepID=UPI0007838112|nr:hypothetical protein [Demequina salsinemoris]
MSSISSVGSGALSLSELYASQSTSSTSQAQGAQAPPPPPPPPASSGEEGGYLETAAEALGMDVDDVISALEDGSSLADLAEEQGVSVDDLTAALAAGAPEDMQSADNFDEMIANLVNQTGLGGPGGSMPPPGSTGALGESLTTAQQDALSSIAAALDMDTDTLVTELKSGSSLADLLQAAQASSASAGSIPSYAEDGLLINVEA